MQEADRGEQEMPKTPAILSRSSQSQGQTPAPLRRIPSTKLQSANPLPIPHPQIQSALLELFWKQLCGAFVALGNSDVFPPAPRQTHPDTNAALPSFCCKVMHFNCSSDHAFASKAMTSRTPGDGAQVEIKLALGLIFHIIWMT